MNLPRTLQSHREKLRFVLVGLWNTAAGYLLFAVLFTLFGDVLHYVLILTIGYAIAISQAYICYKFLVFRTKGNYLREYLRFYLVYGVVFAFNLALLPVFVEALGLSPLVAQGIIVLITVMVSYLGHKNFSFRPAPALADEDLPGLQQQAGADLEQP